MTTSQSTGQDHASRPAAQTTKSGRKRPAKNGGGSRRGDARIRIGTLAAILLIWEIGAANINRTLLAPPSEIFAAAYRQAFVDGTLWGPLGDSMFVLFTGLLASLVIGLPLGIAMGRWKTVGYVLDPYVTFLYALPHVALVPLMIIVLGFDYPFRLTYVVLSAVWPIIINTMVGVRSVDPNLVDAATAYCANERQIISRVILPAASPYMVAGFRQAFSAAWAGVIVSEMLSTLVGVGGLIKVFSVRFLTADMFVPIFVIMIIATVIQALTAWLQQRFTPWQRTNAS